MRVARTAWFDGQLNSEKLIFIDETGTTTKMARLCGIAPRRALPPSLTAMRGRTSHLTPEEAAGGLAAPHQSGCDADHLAYG